MYKIIDFILLLSIFHYIYGQDGSGKGADARSTEVSVGCFSSDSSVKLVNEEDKFIGNIKTGDEILTINHFKIVPSEMIFMLDKHKSKKAKFYTFQTASGHKISLTDFHLIPIKSFNNNINYIPAKNIQLGDHLFVIINRQIQTSPIINISIEMKTGYYAPLTMTGTLLVNDVLASCYASVKSHDLAQIFMTPFRWYYKLTRFISLTNPFNENQTDGIHWIVEIIYQYINFILPSTLQS